MPDEKSIVGDRAGKTSKSSDKVWCWRPSPPSTVEGSEPLEKWDSPLFGPCAGVARAARPPVDTHDKQ